MSRKHPPGNHLPKNQPFRLPISVNLSTFLPARANDSLRLTLRYIVTRDNPFQKLAEKMKEVNLVSTVSALNLEWGTAVKVSEITANLLREGEEDTIFELFHDINVSELKAGYWILYGSKENVVAPCLMEISDNEFRSDPYMDEYCYVILKVLTLPKLKDETARSHPWWQLLQAGKDKALSGISGSSRQRDAALLGWEATLLHVKAMARRDEAYLIKDIEQIIGKAQGEIDEKLSAGVKREAFGAEEYPEVWQEVLGVQTPEELKASLRQYQEELNNTEHLMKVYKDMEA